MTVLIAGASGLIGTELRRQLEQHGHAVWRLVRRPPRSAGEFEWDPRARIIDTALIDGADAVINLSGASLSRLPWTPRYKRRILESRLQATNTLTDAMRLAAQPPVVFLSASAVGIYGDQPGRPLREDSAAGSDYLAGVVRRWEAAAGRAPESTRTVMLRSGLVLARGGALRPLRALALVGLCGPIGTGAQYWPWISLHDEAAAIRHLLTSKLAGPVNLVGPTPARAERLLRSLAAALHRPYGMPLPERVVELALGDAGRQLLLADQNVSAAALVNDGFAFRHQLVDQAVAWALAR
ncbi:TIGR01777 family oxidoreductase [Rathayibacter soli]|uniref:TIGR01777 family oxidoreductase n=1 Tax=Rathayibacter soli TaxID=3144168 RepID=UPI0027E4E4F6|nr:TIGR01777 family oxidoreductase [Glaciibacter superstes]